LIETEQITMPGKSAKSAKSAVATLFLSLATVIALGACTAAPPAAQPAPAPAAPVELTLLYFNDIHGQLEPFEEDDPSTGGRRTLGGIARLAARVREVEREAAAAGRPVFLLFAGDLLMGTPMSMVFRGEPGMLCFREMGVDAFAVGNHEFDFGQQNLRKLIALGEATRGRGSPVPIISCNVDGPDGRPLVPEAVELALAPGASLLVIGATTVDTPVTTFPDNVEGLRFTDPVPRIRGALARRALPGPAVVLSHIGWSEDRRVAEEVPGLTAVVGGHDQVPFDPPRQANGTPVAQAHDRGRYLGRLDLRWEPATGAATVTRAALEPVTDELPEDPVVAAIVRRYAGRLSAKLDRPVARAEVTLDAARDRVRYHETNLGNLFADIMRQATGAEAALLNAGSIRATINRGDVTLADLYRAFPYANELWTVELSGATLLDVLSRSVRGSHEDEDGGFLQVSGLSFSIDGKRPTGVRVGGAPLDPARMYKVAITDFLRAGGDGYAMLKDAPAVETKLPLRDAIIEAFQQRGTVTAEVEGRIRRRP
jgi:2',3'-cyclic-nucleotide 2'-phosphodiesterase (5'-nucleotidase family)